MNEIFIGNFEDIPKIREIYETFKNEYVWPSYPVEGQHLSILPKLSVSNEHSRFHIRLHSVMISVTYDWVNVDHGDHSYHNVRIEYTDNGGNDLIYRHYADSDFDNNVGTEDHMKYSDALIQIRHGMESLYQQISQWVNDHQQGCILLTYEAKFSDCAFSADIYHPDTYCVGKIFWFPEAHDSISWMTYTHTFLQHVSELVTLDNKKILLVIHREKPVNAIICQNIASPISIVCGDNDDPSAAFRQGYSDDGCLHKVVVDLFGKQCELARYDVRCAYINLLEEVVYQLDKAGICVNIVSDAHDAFSFHVMRF